MTAREQAIVGCILAGGRSRRMGGGDKFRRTLGGRPLIEHLRSRLLPQVDALIVAARGPGLEDLGLDVVFDDIENAGPLAGVLAALDWVGSTQRPDALVLTVPADTPFVPADLAAGLAAARAQVAAEIATATSHSGIHYPVSLWPCGLAGTLRSWLLGGHGASVRDFLATRRTTIVRFEGPVDPFFNVNDAADLREAERLIGRVRSATSPK